MSGTSCWNGEENEKEGVADMGYEQNTSPIPILLQGSAGRKESEIEPGKKESGERVVSVLFLFLTCSIFNWQ